MVTENVGDPRRSDNLFRRSWEHQVKKMTTHMYVCMYVSIYIAHYRMELNPDLMTLFRFQFGRCDWTRMFNVISLKAIKDPCVMRAAFLHGATATGFWRVQLGFETRASLPISKALTL